MLFALLLAAAPPAPAPVPESLAAPVDGYDLRTPFQIWRSWVEVQKDAATERLLTEPEAIEGYESVGEPIIAFEKHNDFGLFLRGEIRAYCRRSATGGIEPRNCLYRLRRAYVEDDAGGYDNNAVARWTREAFDATSMAAHLRALGYAPDTDWWLVADRAQMFSVLPSAVPMLMQNATVVHLDTRECPELRGAIAALERRRLDSDVDLPTVGADQSVAIPSPHAIRFVYTLRTLAPDAEGPITIRGNSRSLRNLVHPVLDTADRCEQRRSNAATPD